MEVKLLHNSPLWLCAYAIRFSHDNHDKSDTFGLDQRCHMYSNNECGEKDKALIARVGNKMKHKSVLEQLVYWFDIDGISRACLQELARHRTARLTVKSSRYTLNELKESDNYHDFIVVTPNENVNYCNTVQLEMLRKELNRGTSNDIVKYMLPEAFKTRLQWQIDGRNLQSFLELRSSREALWEIQLLARSIFDALPEEHKYLYEEYMKDNV